MNQLRNTQPFRADEAARLLCGLVINECERLGVRALSLKGEAAITQGLREPTSIADADILIDPPGFMQITDRLTELGWHERGEIIMPRVVPVHSHTLLHTAWPADIDLHFEWPGFLVAPTVAFDLLWDRHESVPVAHRDIPAPTKLDHALILVLHALRNPESDRSQRELPLLYKWFREELSTSEHRLAYFERASALGAADTAQPLWQFLGITSPSPATHTPSYASWMLRAQGDTATGWLTALINSRGRSRTQLIIQFLMPSTAHLTAEFPRLSRVPAGYIWAWFARLLRSMSRLPRVLILQWKYRESSRNE
ncbi:MAG: nucleotidyltransferase family protein [Microbacteriaceae bacterium]